MDQTRPLPVVIATMGEETASLLKGGVHLFGVLHVRTGPPRAKEQLAQCSRCFAWGHRAATCTSKKKCIRCGSVDHTSQACSESATARHCFACNGDHSVTYAGCRANADARRRLANALTPAKARPMTARTPAAWTDGRSFADVTKSGRGAATDWTFVSYRRQPPKADASSAAIEAMETEACAHDCPEPNTSPIPSVQPPRTTDPTTPATRAHQDRTEKSRELALRTRDVKKRLREIEVEQQNIAVAQDSGLSSRRLSRRLRTINGHH